MIRRILLILSLGPAAALAQQGGPAQNRTAPLVEYERMRYGMFICFGMNTYTGEEDYPHGAFEKAPATTYAPPATMDVRAWVRVAKDAGMKYAVLPVKHVTGFCLWDSAFTNYSVAASSNKTDVVAQFMAACKAEGIKPGFYYSIVDGQQEGNIDDTAAVTPAYYKFCAQQLAELHMRYPGVYLQWIDMPNKLSPPQRRELYNIIKQAAPKCLVLMNQTLVGGDDDGTVARPSSWPTDIVNGDRTCPPDSGHVPFMKIGRITYYLPMETRDSIAQKWFFKPGDTPKSGKELHDLYNKCAAHGANLLLGVPPDRDGKIPDDSIKSLTEAKALIDAGGPQSLAYRGTATASSVRPGGHEPDKAFDEDTDTFWAADGKTDQWLAVDLGIDTTFNKATISEVGGVVTQFELQYKSGREWKPIASGTTIGSSLDLTFAPVTARVVRLFINAADDAPAISELRLFDDPTPPATAP